MSDVSLIYGVTTVNIPFPNVPYETIIDLPFDTIRLDDGTIILRDEGSKYDKRTCNAVFELPADNNVYGSDVYLTQGELDTFLYSTSRGHDIVCSLPVSCSFTPFGPDKGDVGPFTLSAKYKDTPAIQQTPFKYFKCSMEWVHTGSYPAYTLLPEISDGLWTFGTITNCRMPSNMFTPSKKYDISVAFTENSSSKYFDRGTGGETHYSSFTLQCNQSKAAAILYYLTNTVRTSQFTITPQDYYCVFGADHVSSAEHTVCLASPQIKVRALNFNSYEIDLVLKRV